MDGTARRRGAGLTGARPAPRGATGLLRRSDDRRLAGGPTSRRAFGSETTEAAFAPDKTGSMTLSMNARRCGAGTDKYLMWSPHVTQPRGGGLPGGSGRVAHPIVQAIGGGTSTMHRDRTQSQ
ncbi:hypothetical protein Pth03_07180 [Planotetraspora thailandica]|uniref:Uncharacterized protein n=1 Tax=Planotetraspora thailandica TaxID=487172 RepID=A0A8J3UUL1_9ACTN|nr:hypothetical protein Pth03_07180 [Planotetraspora thailandica]